MRRFFVVIGGVLLASACAAIAGLDDPSTLFDSEAGADAAPSDATGTSDANDGGPPADADAGRSCTGPLLKTDSFDDRTDAAAGWSRNYAGDGGLIEITGGRLHIRVPPSTTGQNIRRQLDVLKATPKRMCVSFSVEIQKPQDTSAYFDGGDTTFGFVAVRGPVGDASVTFYEGVSIDSAGSFAYVYRPNTVDERPLGVPITTKWRVYVSADFVANTTTVAINDREETFTMVRPNDAPADAIFTIGIRNKGPAPEAEAFFDDVVVVAE